MGQNQLFLAIPMQPCVRLHESFKTRIEKYFGGRNKHSNIF
jgi:hypothetical protein